MGTGARNRLKAGERRSAFVPVRRFVAVPVVPEPLAAQRLLLSNMLLSPSCSYI